MPRIPVSWVSTMKRWVVATTWSISFSWSASTATAESQAPGPLGRRVARHLAVSVNKMAGNGRSWPACSTYNAWKRKESHYVREFCQSLFRVGKKNGVRLMDEFFEKRALLKNTQLSLNA